ncbi:hypothetical protein KG112_10990 [Nocardioides sp. zg-ZUI104]|uniref:hypothetical protein n=1 Tax=Nocardioides faecalis TaxID=2803858 RepID=UPI001BD17092|nr:hypothetical protein [Nocardioides faecalis]MBS4753327.1 hypothetical protein [Nocardioides faecalis]
MSAKVPWLMEFPMANSRSGRRWIGVVAMAAADVSPVNLSALASLVRRSAAEP